MSERILDLSQTAGHLCARNETLVLSVQGRDDLCIPFRDLAAVVVSHPQVTFSQAALAGLAHFGAAFVICTEKHLPAAMMLPLDTHFVQSERFEAQAACPLPTRKRLWKQLVRAKLLAQAKLLTDVAGGDHGLPMLLPEVRSGDPANVEAQAARRYWPALFGPQFRRDPAAEDQNRLLNYGYAVLRALVARAICAHGLHPSLSLHHHNRYDAFRLADDLMEPFRPDIDRLVHAYASAHGATAPLDQAAKKHLLQVVDQRYPYKGERVATFDVLSNVAASLVAVLENEAKLLNLPDFSSGPEPSKPVGV